MSGFTSAILMVMVGTCRGETTKDDYWYCVSNVHFNVRAWLFIAFSLVQQIYFVILPSWFEQSTKKKKWWTSEEKPFQWERDFDSCIVPVKSSCKGI